MLIADTAEYVLGVPKDDTAKGQRDAEIRRAGYTALIDSFAQASPGDPFAARLAAFVHGPFPAVLADRIADLGGTSSDLVAFIIDGVRVHEMPRAQAFWTVEVARRKGTGAEAVCSVCGGTAPALASLPESIPGPAIPVVDSAGRPARGQQAQLVSINNAAQGRAGVIQLANTPICPDCGGDSVAGLVHLLGEERSRRRNRDSVLVWWSNDTALDDEDPLGDLDKPNHDAVLLFDVTDGNPNGDPDNSGAPRTDLETGHGIVTDVALKRKIRDVIPLIAPGRKGYDIYVEAGVALEERHLRAYAGLGADPKAKTLPVAQARDWMIGNFYDVRMFGAVMASKIAPAGKTRGPVQLTFARSVEPVLVVENGITRVTQTRQADVDDGQTTEMGTKWTIPYALYRGVIHFRT